MKNNDFQPAFWVTAGLILGLSILSTAGAAAEPLYFAWFLAVAAWVLGVLIGLGALLAGRSALSGGIFAGVAVGVLALATTCFVNLGTGSIG